MESILFRYRSRQLDANDIAFVKETIARHYNMGRSHISRILCEAWVWKQPNGKLKECATGDILLRMEERGLVKLPPHIKTQKNSRTKTFDQIPLFFVNQELSGSIKYYKKPKGYDWQEILKGVICGIIFSAIIITLACPGWLVNI